MYRQSKYRQSRRPHHLTFKAGLLYFLIVFSVGFVLGIVRIVWVVPRLGIRTAELIEMPFMLLTIVLAAYWVVRWRRLSSALWPRLGMGLTALVFLLFAELGVVLQLRGLSLADYVADRDPISGAIYYIMLFVLATMPSFIFTKRGHSRRLLDRRDH